MCDYRLFRLGNNKRARKGWGNGSDWEGCEMEYDAEEVTGWVKIEAAKKMEIMKILRKGDLEEMSFGNLRRVHHAISQAPNAHSQPLSIISIHRTSCVCVSLGKNSMLACNQSIYMIKRFPSSSSFLLQPPSPLDFLHRRFPYRSRVKCEVYWWYYSEQELPLWPAILLISFVCHLNLHNVLFSD